MMGPLEWKAYLQECSRQIISGPEDRTPLLSEAVLRSGWLGYEGASSSAVRQAEARLGVKLPPSLRAFYSASNGWRTVGCFIYEVPPVEKLGWLTEVDPHLASLAGEDDDNDYDQTTRVRRSLAVSLWGDASMWLLDPGTVNSSGEWAGGRWSSWNPAMRWIADSFEGLFRDEYETYLRLRKGN
jgi:hypothetical protein